MTMQTFSQVRGELAARRRPVPVPVDTRTTPAQVPLDARPAPDGRPQDFDKIAALALDGLTSPRSRRRYRHALDDFLTWYTSEGYRELSKAAVQAYKAKLQADGLAASTINVALSAIRKLATEAADNGLLDEHTAAAVRRVSNVRAEVVPAGREVAPGEIAGLMQVCGKDPSAAGVRDAALVGVLYVTGARRSEVAVLELGDYDAESGALTIRHGKGRKQRVVYVTNGARQALDDWLQVRGADPGPLFVAINRGGRILAHGITGQAIARILSKRADQAGVDELTPHDLRRTMVGDMLDAGADLATVQKVCGHASPTTTARYDRRPEEAKRKAAGLLHVPYFGRA
jgi:site-specific recombinase XerD